MVWTNQRLIRAIEATWLPGVNWKHPETPTRNDCEPSDQSPVIMDRPIRIRFCHAACHVHNTHRIDQSSFDTLHPMCDVAGWPSSVGTWWCWWRLSPFYKVMLMKIKPLLQRGAKILLMTGILFQRGVGNRGYLHKGAQPKGKREQ